MNLAAKDIIESEILKAAEVVENQLDSEIDKLNRFGDLTVQEFQSELDILRQKRLEELKLNANQEREWRQKGHGTFEELKEEKDFFAVTKESNEVVIHFYKNGSFRCDIFDYHLKIIASKHVETRFVKINAEKAMFLAERLKITVLPTLLIVNGSTNKMSKIVGFTELGNCDDFSTEMLIWCLAKHGVVSRYMGDLTQPPSEPKRTIIRCT